MKVLRVNSELKAVSLIIFILFQAFFVTKNSFASPFCGDLANALGPLDYTNPKDRKTLPIVESVHFTPEVVSLQESSGNILDGISYTLRVFPNHHRALHTITQYEIRERRKSQQKNETYKPPMTVHGYPASAECYFDRAIRWRPNDPTVRLLHGLFLHLSGNLEQALAEYKVSERIQPNLADLQYNLGLLYFDKKQYDLAKEHAKKAYQLGYPLPGLRKKLITVGQWP